MAKVKEDKTKQKATLVKVLRVWEALLVLLGAFHGLAPSVALTPMCPSYRRAVTIYCQGRVDFRQFWKSQTDSHGHWLLPPWLSGS